MLPALSLLHEAQFKGAEDEYHSAHKHYREGRYEEAITDAAKAFESTMKTICYLRGWKYKGTSAAKQLIDIMVEQLVPPWTREHLHGFTSSLLGAATVRNNLGAHGTGSDAREVPAHLAAYALHLAASNRLMLVRAHQAAPMQPAEVGA